MDMDKQKQDQKNFLLELLRYAALENRSDTFSDEYEMSVYSTWYLLNPLSLHGREEISAKLTSDDGGSLTCTAHAHHGEPLDPSPDDIVIYDLMKKESGEAVNFIIDGFDCKKVDV